MKQAYFYLPCGNELDSESPNFRGYYDVNHSWNGWKCPKFKEEEIDKEDIIQKLYKHCFKDKEYLGEILFEYLELLEDQEIGLCGIVETLEDRGVKI